MSRVTLHVGAGKCGSSAIQVALSRKPSFAGEGGRTYNYTTVNSQGAVSSGNRLSLAKRQTHVKSESVSRFGEFPLPTLRAIRSELLQIENPILSNEAMFSAPQVSREVLGRLALPIRIVAYVRPQVEYVNSAWWQWGAWSDMPRRDWIRQRIDRSQWHGFLSRWAAIDEVEEVVVRLLPRDVVADFFSIFGHKADDGAEAVRVNPSLPAVALRFLQRNPELRERFSDQIDFRLPELLEGAKLTRTPWVVNPALAKRIVDRVTPGNLLLLGMLSSPDREAMRTDPRWWDASTYADRPVEPFEAPPASDPEMEAMAARLLEAAFEPGAGQRRSWAAAVLDLRPWRS